MNRLVSISAVIGCTAALVMTAPAHGAAVDFDRQIRPILSDHCFACHGPDAKERKADLRLDTKDGALADLGGHFAILPGKPEESELVRRIASIDPDQVMPPPDSRKKLSAEQIELLRRWVAEGATWQSHWSYQRPARSPIPAVVSRPESSAVDTPGAHGSAATTPIDAFIGAKLVEMKLSPAAEADRVTLARRLSFDLVGLPPTPRDVDAFLADTSPQAYEKLVDRLLASPHFGERMAMYWLDLVRFADTNGYHGDNHRDISLYRDYVIDAFNRNKPFDRFTVEQLAGDLVGDASRESKIASGYNHLLMTTREGGAQAKEYTAKYAADRVRNVSTLWLGATLGCAECHDHKFDPYLTKDFYSFAAFFADVKEVAVGVQEQVSIPDTAESQHMAELERQVVAAREELNRPTPELASAQTAWEASLASQGALWTSLKPTGALTASGATLTVAADGAMLVGGAAPPTDVYTIVAPVALDKISALQLEALPHDSLPGKGPGRAANGNFVLSEVRCSLAPKANPALARPLVLQEASADYTQAPFSPAGAIDGKLETGWAIAPKMNAEHVLVLEVQGAPPAGEAILTIELVQAHGDAHNLGRFRISATGNPQPVRARQTPGYVLEALAVAESSRTDQQKHTLATYFRSIAPQLEPARQKLAAAEKAKSDYAKALPTTLVSMPIEPRTMRILPRGNWLSDAGDVVNPGVPAFLPPLAAVGPRATRLDLARWMVAPDNPLVARVFVNRLWKLVFGQGIVKSLDDFGAQGTGPTHPELLDWLANEFVDSGWDVKHMLKLMVMSASYRQSSLAGESLRQTDPYNKWLARQSRFRLDAEMIRDNALATSGLLSEKIGGVSVKPYQPRGYWSHLNFPVREYESDHGESQYRRGLYTYWARTFLHPSLLAFDAPTREECSVERPRSNTPIQALVLLNDPTYVEAARVFAYRVMTEGGSDPEARLRWAYRQVLSREPESCELALLAELVSKHRTEFAADAASARQLISAGEAPVPAGVDAGELAAWTSVVRVLFNLHETITRT